MANNWKDTLLMPQTDFEMKANLATKEPEYQDFWLKKQIYQKALLENQKNGKGKFILHDGPPYANGNIHVGHALNKILKDIIVRRKTMEGFYSPYVPGWDTHGLPIENKMLNEMGMSKDDFDPLALRIEAKKYALKQIENQKKQFAKLQLFSDMKKTYQTFDPQFEVGQLKLFKKMALDKLIYKGLKPVYWSPSSQSALAEAEVEYQDVRSPQIILGYTVKKGNKLVKTGTDLLVMTTTPWTVIATSGIAVGVEFDYALVKASNKEFVVAKALIESIKELCKWEEYQILNTFKGQELLDLTFISPINLLEAPIVEGHHVTIDVGTGLVQMAPLFGEDDYLIGKKNNLKMIMHVDSKGIINQDGLKYQGLFYADASKAVGQDLDSQNQLYSLKFIKHAYPHDWRTHKPIIYRGVPQWFVNIKPIKTQILKQLKTIKSVPSWGIDRLQEMISNRTEWTISRQRTWGVPIIIFYDQNNNPVFNEEIFDYVIDLVAKNGTDVWWAKETDELLPPKYRNQNWTKEMDIMDVWFDSGSSSIAVEVEKQKAPFDLYLEGSDQYRGWFNSSIINAVAYYQKAPFKTLISHGFVLDGKQQKMSKSKGNVVDPLTMINKYGADTLRLWVANSEYTGDVSISDPIIKQNIEIYRRLRNTFRFMLGNLQDFNFNNDHVKLTSIHQYINNLTNKYAQKINKFYEQYKFLEVVKEINKWFIDLSSWYFDYAKDILYCDLANSLERRSIQTNIYYIMQVAMVALAPILPTTMEEVYRFSNFENKKESIFLEQVEFNNKVINFDQKHLNFIEKYRHEAYKVLEKARQDGLIKRNNEAILIANIANEDQIFSLDELAKYLMVAKVEYGNSWEVKSFESEKCQRCWNHFKVNELNEKQICKRCQKVVENNKK